MPPSALLRLLPLILLIAPTLAASTAADLPTREQLIARFGPPSQIVTPNLWIFWEPARLSARARAAGYDTLVARVEHGRVLLVRWVNGEDLRALLARHAPEAILRLPLEIVAPAPPPPAG